MPPRKKMVPTTFDEHLAVVVDSKRTKKQMSVEEFADAIGITYPTLRRRFAGAPFTVTELYRVADVVGVPAHLLVQEALDDFGGMEKLLAEAVPTSEVISSLDDYRKKNLATVPEEELRRGKHAAGTDEELEQPEQFD